MDFGDAVGECHAGPTPTYLGVGGECILAGNWTGGLGFFFFGKKGIRVWKYHFVGYVFRF